MVFQFVLLGFLAAFVEGQSLSDECIGSPPGRIIEANGIGILDFPEGNVNYTPNSQCYWRIESRSNTILRYRFSKLDLDECDTLLLYERDEDFYSASQAHSEPLTSSEWLETEENYLIIRFVSDKNDQGKGFTLEYVEVDLGDYSSWSSWSDCSVSCGGGRQVRNRTSIVQTCFNLTDSRPCNIITCPVEVIFGKWSEWSACTATCGTATQTRERSCLTGACDGPLKLIQPCDLQPCAIDGKFSEWTEWCFCNVTCGGGMQNRTRTCDDPRPAFGGKDCDGDLVETRICNNNTCKEIDGQWSDWGAWSTCSVTCGEGIRLRGRVCNNPTPVGGLDCQGSTFEESACSKYECTGDDSSDWSPWSDCSVTCGAGVRTRTRNCDSVTNGGVTCDVTSEQIPCNNGHCDCHEPYLGMSCTEDENCIGRKLTNVRCTAGLCSCSTGYYPYDRDTVCARVEIGTPCQSDEFCNASIPDSHCTDYSRTCACSQNKREIVNESMRTLCVEFKTASEYPHCAVCEQTDGVCYDSDGNGSPDTCGCPPCMKPSNHHSSLNTGCDHFYAYPDELCKNDGTVACLDSNSECAPDGTLDGFLSCTCKTGYILTTNVENPKRKVCARQITSKIDGNCTTCEDNGGKCYDINEDDIMDGCLCTPTKTSSCSNPDSACDREHVNINCTSKSITVCVTGKDNFIGDVSEIFVEDYEEQLACHFEENKDGEWCLTLKYDEPDICGLEIKENEESITYTSWIMFRKYKGIFSKNDLSLHAFCSFHKTVRTHSGLLTLEKKKPSNSFGQTVKPALKMEILNKFGQDLEETGSKIGENAKLLLEIVNNKGVFFGLRAEVCTVSGTISLGQEESVVMFILNGCPNDKSGLEVPLPVFAADPLNSLKVHTNYFPLPKFDSPMIFYQCWVKLCMNATECAQRSCSERRRRDALNTITELRKNGQSLTDILAQFDDTYIVPKAVGVCMDSVNKCDKFLGVQKLDGKEPKISALKEESEKKAEEKRVVEKTYPSENIIIATAVVTSLLALFIMAILFLIFLPWRHYAGVERCSPAC